MARIATNKNDFHNSDFHSFLLLKDQTSHYHRSQREGRCPSIRGFSSWCADAACEWQKFWRKITTTENRYSVISWQLKTHMLAQHCWDFKKFLTFDEAFCIGHVGRRWSVNFPDMIAEGLFLKIVRGFSGLHTLTLPLPHLTM